MNNSKFNKGHPSIRNNHDYRIKQIRMIHLTVEGILHAFNRSDRIKFLRLYINTKDRCLADTIQIMDDLGFDSADGNKSAGRKLKVIKKRFGDLPTIVWKYSDGHLAHFTISDLHKLERCRGEFTKNETNSRK